MIPYIHYTKGIGKGGAKADVKCWWLELLGFKYPTTTQTIAIAGIQDGYNPFRIQHGGLLIGHKGVNWYLPHDKILYKLLDKVL